MAAAGLLSKAALGSSTTVTQSTSSPEQPPAPSEKTVTVPDPGPPQVTVTVENMELPLLLELTTQELAPVTNQPMMGGLLPPEPGKLAE